MKNSKIVNTNKLNLPFAGRRLFFIAAGYFLFFVKAHSQNCPPNIDFETGTFNGWTCYTGNVSASGGMNMISLFPSGPVSNRHTMISAIASAGVIDPYGGFPVACPNGSRYSVKLGNDQAGAEAEGMSYEFTIPATQNFYSLIYNYAVVFQDPNHLSYQQPRMEIEILNVTDNVVIDCSSFTFFPNGSPLPGFFLSPNPGGSTPVWCKDWTAVTINLNGMAGKTIRLFFKTADCTFVRHFGYAYIDVNSECSNEFVGATYCPDDTAVNVVAPFGYQSYTWYNNNFTQVLGNQQVLTFHPPPPIGTTVAVQIVPYNGYGCLDTLYATLIDTLTVHADAGRDTLSCNRNLVPIGSIPKPGLVYSWSPTTGLSNPSVGNPLANPDTTTKYILTVRHDGGGCVDYDTVVVKADVINNSLQLIGKSAYCLGSGDSSILVVAPADSIQWFKDNIEIPRATQQRFRVTQSGTYHAMLFNKSGCSIATATQNIFIDVARPGITYPLRYAVSNYPITLNARRFGDSALWSPAINLDNRFSYSPVFNGTADQLYTVKITTNAGCVTVDTQLVKTVKSVEMYVPTAFTPNHNGMNDYLRPILMGIQNLHYFRVYNRWGLLLYESRLNEPTGWDGNLNGVPQSTQVVVWIAEGVGVDGRTYFKKGTSTLVR